MNQIYSELNIDFQLKETDSIVVLDMPYLIDLSRLIVETKPETIANYLGWAMLVKTGFMTTTKFRNNEMILYQTLRGTKEPEKLYKRCMKLITEDLPYLVSRLYVDNYFDLDQLEEVTMIAKDIKETFREILKDAEWIDDKTRQRALKKLNHLINNIGLPLWILNDDALTAYYSNLVCLTWQSINFNLVINN